MTEMIERVAQAIAAQMNANPNLDPAYHHGLARAAIAALREPSKGMLDRHTTAFGEAIQPGIMFWQDMIDDALGHSEG